MQSGVVVFAVGNRSRGDDAIGPLLLERLGAWLAGGLQRSGFELIDDYQLQIEHALDMRGKRLALFIDAGLNTPAPFRLYPIAPADAAARGSTHALSPEGVLSVYRSLEGAEPPPSFVLCVRGERFELGEALSVEAEANFAAAWQRLTMLCACPDAASWHAAVEG